MKYCKKCKKEYTENKNFCEECGGKLIKMIMTVEKKPKIKTVKSPKAEAKPQLNMKKYATFLAIGVVIIIGILLISLSGSQGGVIPGQQCQNIQEPYTEQEAYQEPLSYSIISSTITEDWNTQLGFFQRYKVIVSNGDDAGGSFVVNYALSTSNHGTLMDSKTAYINAHSTETFEAIFNTDMGEQVSGTHQVTPPTKTAYRTVTKYRIVQKCA